MAKGALIALHGCDPQAAFDELKNDSQRRNIKLRDVAGKCSSECKRSPSFLLRKASSCLSVPPPKSLANPAPSHLHFGVAWRAGASVRREFRTSFDARRSASLLAQTSADA
jgi:hypothetical protein